MIISFLFILIGTPVIYSDHFNGGTINWRPVDSNPNSSSILITITQTYSWMYPTINCLTDVPFSTNWFLYSIVSLTCIANCSTQGGYSNTVNALTDCTSYSTSLGVLTSQRSVNITLNQTTYFWIAYQNSPWRTLTNAATNFFPRWSIASLINLRRRPDGLINTSPVAYVASPQYVVVNKTTTITIPVTDVDIGDDIRCRWSSPSSASGIDQCGDVCPTVNLTSIATLSGCTLTFTPMTSSVWYAIALQVEDFINTTSTDPMSSVPVQFLIYVLPTPNCTQPPVILPLTGCLEVQVNVTKNFTLYAMNYCDKTKTSIIDIRSTTSITGMSASSLVNSTTNTSLAYVTFTWTPQKSQIGFQQFCALAYTNDNVQSALYCVTFTVVTSQACTTTSTSTTTTTSSTTTTTSTTTSTSTTTTTSTSTTTTTNTTTSTTTTTTITMTTTTITSTTTTSTTTTTTTSSTTTSTSTTTTTSATTTTTSTTITTITTTTTTRTSITSISTTTTTSSTTTTTSSTATITTTTTTTSSTTTTTSTTTSTSTTTTTTSTTTTTTITNTSTTTTTTTTITTTITTTTTTTTSTSTTTTTTTASSTATTTTTSTTTTATTSIMITTTSTTVSTTTTTITITTTTSETTSTTTTTATTSATTTAITTAITTISTTSATTTATTTFTTSTATTMTTTETMTTTTTTTTNSITASTTTTTTTSLTTTSTSTMTTSEISTISTTETTTNTPLGSISSNTTETTTITSTSTDTSSINNTTTIIPNYNQSYLVLIVGLSVFGVLLILGCTGFWLYYMKRNAKVKQYQLNQRRKNFRQEAFTLPIEEIREIESTARLENYTSSSKFNVQTSLKSISSNHPKETISVSTTNNDNVLKMKKSAQSSKDENQTRSQHLSTKIPTIKKITTGFKDQEE